MQQRALCATTASACRAVVMSWCCESLCCIATCCTLDHSWPSMGHVDTFSHQLVVTDLDGFFFCLGVEQAGSLALLVLYLLLDGLNLPSTLRLQRLFSHKRPCHPCTVMLQCVLHASIFGHKCMCVVAVMLSADTVMQPLGCL